MPDTALQRVDTHALTATTTPAQGTAILATREEKKLAYDLVASGQNMSDPEFELFINVCQTRGLNPLARQIYAIRRKGQITHQTSIDGFRLIADRTGRYVPGRETVYTWAGAPGEGYPLTATVYVQKLVAGAWHEISETAYWKEYYPGDGKQGTMWRNMPTVMLARVAEARALRRAFPEDLSGIYTDHEMDQADGIEVAPQPARKVLKKAEPAKAEPTTEAETQRIDPADFKTRSLGAIMAMGLSVQDKEDLPLIQNMLGQLLARTVTTEKPVQGHEYESIVEALERLAKMHQSGDEWGDFLRFCRVRELFVETREEHATAYRAWRDAAKREDDGSGPDKGRS